MFSPTNGSIPCDVVVDNLQTNLIHYSGEWSHESNEDDYWIYDNTISVSLCQFAGCSVSFSFQFNGALTLLL